MRFFTPELYIRFNSTDEEEASRANEEWENAIQEYRKHLESIRAALPSYVRNLAQLSLHDAELLAIDQEFQPAETFPEVPRAPFWAAVAILSLKQEGAILSLIYFLWDHVREFSYNDWPFAKERPHWLYDEIDLGANHGFIHRILCSDGTTVEIPFVSAVIHRLPLKNLNEKSSVRRVG